ncbi:MAG: SIS domain-containing protein [Cryobacterium sp.]|nr:SIS domain-containing protein [Oligoflexia bacterium]
MSATPESYLNSTFEESLAIKQVFFKENFDAMITGSKTIAHSVTHGGKLLIFGNGGSAADAQHTAAEMVGRMLIDRRPLPAIALTTDTSNLTAIGNDFGYDMVFLKQVQALARKEDVILAISTSGNSKNVILAVEEAKRIGAKVITLTGGTGGKLKALADVSINVSTGTNSSRIQESHIFALHSLVDLMDRFFLDDSASTSERHLLKGIDQK